METLAEAASQTLNKHTRVSPGSTPVQTGFDLEVSVQRTQESGGTEMDDVLVVGGSEVKMTTSKKGKKQSLRKRSGLFVPMLEEENINNGVEKISTGLNDEEKQDWNSDDDSKEVDEDDEEMGEQEHEFFVGDLVWGKIRSHPWWPGLIYSPSDASAAAAKYKRRNRLLVAYFGDGTFAWCYPSQLKPFQEKFDQLANQSNSKSFTRAVEEAMNEIGRRLDLEMACSCLAKKHRPVSTVAMSAGIKEGVAVPYGGTGELSITRFDPVEFLAHLRYTAQMVSIDNMLDLLVLEHRLCAFYRAKGYDRLPVYHEPVGILVPEDSAGDEVSEEDDFKSQKSARIGNSAEVNWNSSGPDVGSTGITVSRRHPWITKDSLFESKKQRTIASLMAGKMMDEGGSVAHEGTLSGKTTVSSKKRKENIGAETGNIDKETETPRTRKKNKGIKDEHGDDATEEGAASGKTTLRSSSKKKGSDVGNSGDVAGNDAPEEGTASGKTTLRSSSRKKGSEVGNSDGVARENKIGDSEVPNANNVAEKLTVSEKQSTKPKTRKKILDSDLGNDDDEVREVSVSEKHNDDSRKRKKYKDFEFEDDKDVGEDLASSGKQTEGSRLRKRNTDFELGNGSGMAREGLGDGKQASHSKLSKKTKLAGPSVTGDDKVAVVENDDFGTSSIIPEGSIDVKQVFPSKMSKKPRNAGPPVSGESKASVAENDDFGVSGMAVDGSTEIKQVFPSMKPKKTKLAGLSVTGEDKAPSVENYDLDTKEEGKSGASLRERKKSKYLSPPYTNITLGKKNAVATVQSKKENPDIISISLEQESISPAAGKSTNWPPMVKCSGEPFDAEVFKESRPESYISGGLSPSTPKESFKNVFENGNVSAHEMLSNFRTAALDPLNVKKKQSNDTMKGFFTEFRSSLCSGKRVSFATTPESPGKINYETGHAITKGESERKRRRKKEGDFLTSPKPNLPSPKLNLQQAGGTLDKQMSPEGGTNSDISVAALLLTFAPGISLPSKDQLITTFSRFGALKESETELIEDSGCAQVVYVRSSDAKEAYNEFEKINPFGSSVVSHRLRYFSANSRASPMKRGKTPIIQSASHSQVSEVPSLLLVRQNLAKTTSALESAWDKLSSEAKADLDGDIKSLLNKVTSMVRSSSS